MNNIEKQPEVQSGLVINNPEGKIIYRNNGRAYWSYETRIDDFWELNRAYRDLLSESREHGRRRTVLRCRCSQEVLNQLLESDLPREVVIPLNTIWSDSTDYLVILGENIHPSEISEWASVYEYWQSPNGSKKTPLDRIEYATTHEGFELTDHLSITDAARLAEIWQPFGWTESGATQFIEDYQNNHKLWFSGLRDPENGQLVSACEAELANFAGINLIEGTEYGTLPGYEGLGLCTAGVTALHAQVLRDTYYQNGEMPLIFAEFNMTSRSDVVGRHTGITIPLVENTPGLESTPIQVLKLNVPVLDRLTPNDQSFRALGERRHHYRNAYRQTYHRYWRNFIVGILPQSSVDTYYQPEQMKQILATINREN